MGVQRQVHSVDPYPAEGQSSDPNPLLLLSARPPNPPRAKHMIVSTQIEGGMRKYCMNPTRHIEPSCVNIVEQDIVESATSQAKFPNLAPFLTH